MARVLSSDVINPGMISQEFCWIPYHCKFLKEDYSLYWIIHCIQRGNKEREPQWLRYSRSQTIRTFSSLWVFSFSSVADWCHYHRGVSGAVTVSWGSIHCGAVLTRRKSFKHLDSFSASAAMVMWLVLLETPDKHQGRISYELSCEHKHPSMTVFKIWWDLEKKFVKARKSTRSP